MARVTTDFSTYSGPTDPKLGMSEIGGYQPVSRIGEIVQNCFVDAHEWEALPDEGLSVKQIYGAGFDGTESKPMFYEWASVLPGMICLSRKKKISVYRNHATAQSAMPVIASAACMPKSAEKDFFFAGVARSKSVPPPDDGQGPTIDEMFTLSIGGMATLLNTSSESIHPGDMVEWTFVSGKGGTRAVKRGSKPAPRRIGIQSASASSSRIIGRALSFAKAGETLDILIKQ